MLALPQQTAAIIVAEAVLVEVDKQTYPSDLSLAVSLLRGVPRVKDDIVARGYTSA